MPKLSAIGRIFYGIAIAGTGILTIYANDFPYMLLPPRNFYLPGLAIVTGIIFIIAGGSFVFGIKARQVGVLFGVLLLLIFCFYFVPYQFLVSPNYMHLGDWENAEKELALAGGSLTVAACLTGENDNSVIRFFGKLIPLGAILFGFTILSFGILHFMFTKEASTLVPVWIPFPIFWTYVGGVGLLGSGIAIVLKIKTGLIATLMGTMILIWFVILHIPRAVVAPSTDIFGETISAFLALAYSGTAFMIAGMARRAN